MSKKRIIIKILPDGQVQAEISGIPGKGCLDYLSLVETLTEAKVIDTQLTGEFFQENIQVAKKQEIKSRIQKP